MRLASEQLLLDERWQRLWVIFEPGDGVLHQYYIYINIQPRSTVAFFTQFLRMQMELLKKKRKKRLFSHLHLLIRAAGTEM